jgi:hypothetical protein
VTGSAVAERRRKINNEMELDKFSIGIGDRFGQQGAAQLRALLAAREEGIAVAPVWNKSAREHSIIGSRPEDTRRAAQEAVAAAGWNRPYFVDADHINLATIDEFIDSSDFFTIDVADVIGRRPDAEAVEAFLAFAGRFAGKSLPGSAGAGAADRAFVAAVAFKYAAAVREAGKIFRRIAGRKGEGRFITEISMDETDSPQSPAELFFILAAAALEKIDLRTIAPKWSGRFNKGVDYEGDVDRFETEFADAVEVVGLAAREFGLPGDLKLSIHSGSDKFSLYPRVRRTLERTGAGLHLKTAGTTWLEEVIGLAEAGGDGWERVKGLYRRALERYEELCKPYLPVLAIDRGRLPAAREVESWTGGDFVRALRHDAEMGNDFLDLLEKHEAVIGRNVTENLLERHIRLIFPSKTNAKSSPHQE